MAGRGGYGYYRPYNRGYRGYGYYRPVRYYRPAYYYPGPYMTGIFRSASFGGGGGVATAAKPHDNSVGGIESAREHGLGRFLGSWSDVLRPQAGDMSKNSL